MTGAPHQRLDSLDVFRGVTIAAMILVSTPGTWTAVYGPLNHAAWDGWTATDLVFPFLLFAMGAAVPFALARRRDAAAPVRRHVFRRAAILFALGLVLNAIESPQPLHWETFRIPGVLQRIALVYLAVTWMTESMAWRTQLTVAASLLAGYWALLTIVPVPGAGPGVLTPSGNLASFVDRIVFRRHLLTPVYDPEGLLSTLPAIATALGGVFAGDWLKRWRDGRRTVRLCAAGAAAMLIALAWSRVFPINKTLWTSSFALFSAGIAAQVLALCHWIVGVKHWRRGVQPLVAFGRNPLTAYFLSVGVDSILTRWTVNGGSSLKSLLYDLLFASWIEPRLGAHAASLAYALAYVLLWGTLLSEMYRRRMFLAI
jgi:predicted acyltransferase